MLFLYDIQSPINLGLLLRAGEQFQIPVAIYDPRKIFENKQALTTIQDFSCGAIDRTPPRIVTDFVNFVNTSAGRIVATSLNEKAVPLSEFSFRSTDVILLGNEYDGLPKAVIDSADENLYIPLPPAFVPKFRSNSPIDPTRAQSVAQNGVPNLNVATCGAIISYDYRMQSSLALEQGRSYSEKRI